MMLNLNRVLVTILLFFTMAPFVDAQKIWITPDIKIKNDFSFELMGRWPSGNLLLFRDKLFAYEVEAYDESMKLLWTKPLKLAKSKLNIIGLNHIDTSFTVFYSYKEKSKTIIEYKTFNEQLELLDSKILFVSYNRFDKHSFRYTLSENNKKVLVFYTKDRTSLHLLSYDMSNLVEANPSVVHMDYRLWRNQLEGIKITNEGDIYIVRDVSNSRKHKDKISILCHRISNDGEIIEQLLHPSDLYSGDVHFEFDNINDKLIIVGTYGKKNNNWSNGYWLMKLGNDLSQNDFFFYEFSDVVLREINGNIKHVYKGINDLYISNIIQRKDGGSIIVGEIQKEYSRRPDLNPRINETSFGIRRWVDYYYEDILPMSIHPNGDFHWNSVLHKRQYSQDDEAVFSSFFVMKNPAMLKFMFNDEIKSANTISEYVVTSRGLLERNSLMNTANLKLQLRLRDAIQVNSKTILIPSQTEHQLNIVKMVF